MRGRLWLSVVFVLLIGYAPQISQYVYTKIIRGGAVKSLPTITNFETPCTALNRTSTCGKSYSIPMDLLRSEAASYQDPIVSFGLLLRSVGFRCENQTTYFRTFDSVSHPGMDRAESNRTKTISLDSIPCKTSLVIETWRDLREGRVGWVGGELLVGEYEDIFKIRRINDFWLNDFRIVLALLLLSSWFLVFLIRRNLIASYELSPLERALPWLACSNLLNSGLITSVIPITENPEILNSISLLFSTLAFKAIVINNKSRKSESLQNLLLLGFFFLPINSTYKLHLCSVFILITLVVSLRTSSITNFLFGVFGVLATLKIMNFWWAPHSHVHSVFAFLTLSLGLRRRLVQIFSSVSSQIYSKNYSHADDLERTIKSFLKTFPTISLNLYALDPGSRARLTHADSTSFCTLSVDSLPPIVANVISTGTPTGIRKKNDLEVSLLSKGVPIHSNWIHVIPVRQSNKILGVLEISFDTIAGWDRHMELDTIQISVDLLAISLAEILTKQHSYARGEALSKISSSIRLLEKSGIADECPTQFLSEATLILAESLQCSALLLELSEDTRQMIVRQTHGYTPEAQTHIQQSTFYALEDNRHGPSALAMNENRIIVIEDLSWLKQGIKDKTQSLFEKNGSRSGVALPVSYLDKGSTVKFVLWLESRNLQAFRFEFLENYQALIDYVKGKISEREAKQLAQALERNLSDFVPASARAKISLGLDPTEQDSGFLLMFDLKGSTRLSLMLGLDRYSKFVMELKELCVLKFSNFGFELQEYRWDSFYLTRSNLDVNKTILSSELIHLTSEIEAIFQQWLSNTPELRSASYLSFRMCLVEGDITRGLSVGKTSSWTIVGTAMAKVAKLEASVKNLEGRFFSLNSEPFLNPGDWIDTKQNVPGLETGQIAILKTTLDSEVAA